MLLFWDHFQRHGNAASLSQREIQLFFFFFFKELFTVELEYFSPPQNKTSKNNKTINKKEVKVANKQNHK